MAKRQHRQAARQRGNEIEMVNEHLSDDNLLPDAGELAKLKEVDPQIITWILDKTAKEQQHRHDLDHKRIKLVEKVERGNQWTNKSGLIISLILMLAILGSSTYLISIGKTIPGGLLGGVGALAIIGAFLSKVKSNNGEKTPQPKK